MKPAPHAIATINRTGVFTETLEVRQLAAMPGWVELSIQTVLASAKDPLVKQTRYRAVLPQTRLRELSDALQSFLMNQDNTGSN